MSNDSDYCPVCKIHELRDDAIFCSVCGAGLVVPPPEMECASCHGIVKPSDKYCIHCGLEFKD